MSASTSSWSWKHVLNAWWYQADIIESIIASQVNVLTQQELPITATSMTVMVRCDPHFPRSLKIAISKRVVDIRSLKRYHDCGVGKEQKHLLISSWIVGIANLVLSYVHDQTGLRIRRVSGWFSRFCVCYLIFKKLVVLSDLDANDDSGLEAHFLPIRLAEGGLCRLGPNNQTYELCPPSRSYEDVNFFGHLNVIAMIDCAK